MKSQAKTVDEYLRELPEDRRAVISAIRKVILAHLPEGYEECMSYGMIGYVVPHRIYPAGYHCDPRLPLPYANLGSQKSHLVLHLMAAYGDSEISGWFRHAWEATGKKLDMGQACVRFKKLDEVPLEVVGQMIARVPAKAYIARIESLLASRPKPRPKPRAKH